MPRVRLLVFTVPLLLFAVACGSTSAVSTTSAGNSEGTAAATATATATTTGTVTDSATPVTSATPDGTATSSTTATGSLKFSLVADQSEASYKATEQLAGISSPSDAVGKTKHVSGAIVFDSTGAVDSSASKITIDLTTLASDKSQRDNYIKRNTLNTDQYPDAVFVPTSVQGLTWPLPTSGNVNFTIVGNLTAHGVTAPTTWAATATFAANQIKGSATTTVKFEDFGMTPPKTMLVLSVQDHLTFELDFVFAPAN